MARLLRVGGLFSLFETHPAAWLFDETATDLRVMPGVNYFGAAREAGSVTMLLTAGPTHEKPQR